MKTFFVGSEMWAQLKEEAPLVLTVCPPRGPFSSVQGTNYAKLPRRRMMMILKTGLCRLELAVAMVKWQLWKGRCVIFERPPRAKSWEEPCIQNFLQNPEMRTAARNQCQYGFQVGGGPNRKTARWMTDMEPVARRL